MNLPIFSTSIVLLLCIGFFLVGIILIQRGRWPARTGTTLHCRNCDYILTGLTADRCPECGASILMANIIRGERHRRPGIICAGMILVLLGLIPLGVATIGSVKQIDWIHYRPTTWLIKDLDTPLASSASWNEIHRRIGINSISESHLNLLSEEALQVQKQPKYLSGMTEWAVFKFLSKRYVDGKLTAAQKHQFFDSALKVAIDVRPIVGSQDPVPYRVRLIGRGPDGWFVFGHRLEWRIDDNPIHSGGSGSIGSGSFDGGGSGSSLPANQPLGKHHLHLKVELAAVPSSLVAEDLGPSERTFTRNLETDFEVIAGHASITTVTAPTADVLRPLFTFNLIVIGNDLSATLFIKPPPVDLAFDVFVRAAGKEHQIGGVKFKNNIESLDGADGDINGFPQPFPDRVDIILRSSETVARGTANITQIWKGEIFFKDVPVKLPMMGPVQTLPTQQ